MAGSGLHGQLDGGMVNWSEWYYYDESSPTGLRWAKEIRCGQYFQRILAAVGAVAGSFDKDTGYWKVALARRYYRCHRIIYEMMVGPLEEDEEVDHFDGQRLNNNLNNLRKVSSIQNMRNKGMYENNKSGVTGVFRSATGEGKYFNWGAQWCDPKTGRKNRKSFSIQKYGEDEAFRLACEFRAARLEELKGTAGYTETHGEAR